LPRAAAAANRTAMEPGRRELFVLTGCTAVGKTELSLQWAERYDAEIVSCDSLLFYRGMDLGTAKPTAAEQARVPHHLIDLAEPAERLDVVAYAARAQAVVADLLKRGKRPLVVGGSGFYLASFLRPIADQVEVDPCLRGQLEERLVREGLDSLVEELRRLNPEGIENLDAKNPRRVVRALERCLASGQTLKQLREAFQLQAQPFPELAKRITVLDRAEPELSGRIEQRVAAMFAGGLVEEVKQLLTRGIESNPSAAGAIGYREVIAGLRGGSTEEEMASAVIANTRKLVKKQRTWFRHQLPSAKRLEFTGSELPPLEAVFDD
jgi:tRNA dimethylallyltransferase